MTAEQLRIVLVRPKEERNIGSVCRAMKTMGFGNLYIVGGEPIDRSRAEATAVHAVDVLNRAVCCATLDEAVQEAVLVGGISRRRGKWRKYFALSPEQLAGRVASIEAGICALVFGNEASGLNAAELTRCHLAVRIPTSPEFPSLNLSHAVQIIIYQIFRRLQADGGPATFSPVANKTLDSLVSIVIASLANIGFFTQGDPQELGIFFRDIFARAALEKREVERLEVIFRRISGLMAGSGIKP